MGNTEYKNTYKVWLKELKQKDESLYNELFLLDEQEVKEGFSSELTFGTGGMRGVIGLGPNRLNDYTIAKISRAVGQYLNSTNNAKKIAIAYDNRKFSKEFSHLAAATFESMGIEAYVFEEPTPTPTLSFATKEIGAGLGVVITASHNPPEYNGYKVYDDRGVQIGPNVAEKITYYYKEQKMFGEDIEKLKESKTKHMNQTVMERYLGKVQKLLKEDKDATTKNNLTVVYTSLYGSGIVPVSWLLETNGYNATCIQSEYDSNFGGLKSPNPENDVVYEKALVVAKEIDADIILATDPDADRVGALIKAHEGYININGNQIGAILADYVIGKSETNKKKALITTIVSGELAKQIAVKNNVKVDITLTGFKYIGDLADRYQQDGEIEFLFGYEESYGYLTGDFVHDKDAIISTLLLAECAAINKENGKTLVDVWKELSKEYGHFEEDLHTIKMPIAGFKEKTEAIMKKLRNDMPLAIGKRKIVAVEDYLLHKKTCDNNVEDILGFPKSDVLKIFFDEFTWIAVRPSGTEPKIKLYFSGSGNCQDEAAKNLTTLKMEFLNFVDNLQII